MIALAPPLHRSLPMVRQRPARPARRVGWHLACGLLAAVGLLPATASALDLSRALELAGQYDTPVNSARQQLEAVRERLPQAQASLRPSLAAGVGATAGTTDNNQAPRKSFSNVNGALNLAMPLYDPANRVLVDQARIGIQLAEIQLELALQDLVTRVGSAYFDVLAAQDTIEVATAQRRAINEQFEAAKRNFEVGTATVTDQQEAQARLDLNEAQLAAAKNELAIRRAALTQLTGVPDEDLHLLRLDTPLPPADPRALEAWVNEARDSAHNVRLQTLAVENAKKEVDRARYARSPTVDLVSQAAAVQGKTATSAWGAVDRSTSLSAGLLLSVPLYSGGGLEAREREAAALLSRAEIDLETTRRNAEQLTRQAYLGLVSSSEQARALEAAVRSSRLALDSNLLGYQVGVRVNVDVLNAQQQLFQAFRDLSRARYDVLLNGLRLRAVAGQLEASHIQSLNALLSPPGASGFPVTLTPPPAVSQPAEPARPGASGRRTTKPVAPGSRPPGARRSMPN